MLKLMVVNLPLVSVILVVRNGEKFLSEAIRSVLAQHYEPIEIIVVDGRSEDNTVNIARTFNGVQIISQTHLGLADARNVGIDSARGDLIAFLDSDDVWENGKLSAQVDCLRNHAEYQAAITRMRFFIENGCVLHGRHPQQLEVDYVGYTPGSLVVWKNVFKYFGKFNPAYSIGCDTDWFARVSDGHLRMAIIPEVLLYKRIHNNNLSLSTQLYRNEIFSVLKESLARKRNAFH
jgi:glycosyltransferase involved in cell wall biosynthesis